MSTQYVPVRQDARKMAYIRWLTTPPTLRDPATEAELAKILDVYPKTLYNWKQDRDFRDVWHDETDEVVGGDDKRQKVMDTLYEAASDPRNPRHVQAAKLYLDALNAISPPREKTTNGTVKALGLLSDDEIDRLLARGVMEAKALE